MGFGEIVRASDGSPSLLMVNVMGSILWNEQVGFCEELWAHNGSMEFILWGFILQAVTLHRQRRNCPFANYPFHIGVIWSSDSKELRQQGAQTTFELCLCALGLSSLCSHNGTSCLNAYYVNMIFLPIVAPVECVHHNNLPFHSVLQTMVLIQLS